MKYKKNENKMTLKVTWVTISTALKGVKNIFQQERLSKKLRNTAYQSKEVTHFNSVEYFCTVHKRLLAFATMKIFVSKNDTPYGKSF